MSPNRSAQSAVEDVSGVLTPGAGERTRERDGAGSNGHCCARCGERWTALGAAHCGACHLTFSSAGLFDRHREQYGDRGKCVHPSEIKKGAPMEFRNGMWRGPEMTDEVKAKRAGTRNA